MLKNKKDRLMISPFPRVSILLLSVVCTAAGCKSTTGAGNVTARNGVQPAPQTNDANAGSITGTVHFAGKAPERLKIDMSMDPACAFTSGENLSEPFVVSDGHLANVYVYLKTGAPASHSAPGTPAVVLDQHGCRYTPHVVAVQQGGSVDFRNSDPTMHNVHTTPAVGGNPAIDVSQGPGSGGQIRQFENPETMLVVGCNNHPWMRAYINVAPNPYFAVSTTDGSFSIANVPPGTYTVAAVHEKLGEQDIQITVPAHAAAKADFTFSSH